MISNTAQVNTFQGMDMDTDVTMIKDSNYRYAENVRIVTNDNGTTGNLQNIEGVKQYINSNINSNETIIGTCTVDKYGIVITVDNNNINRVYRITDFDKQSLSMTVILKGKLNLCYNLDPINLSIVSNYETNSNIKIYFTDGKSAIKELEITNSPYTIDNQDSGLVDSDGNIINVYALDITPGCILPPFQLQTLGIGNLPSGCVQYCYQLFNLHGTETTVSPLSPIIHLTQSTTNQNSQKYEGSMPYTSSGKSCTVHTNFITKDFSKCRIIRIQYLSDTTIPEIKVIDEIDISSLQTDILYTDTGNSIMGEISVDEFNQMVGYQFFANNIAKTNNRLFAANITEDTWDIDTDLYDTRAYRCNTSGIVKLNSSDNTQNLTFNMEDIDTVNIPNTHDCINPYNLDEYATITSSSIYAYGEKDSSGNYILGGKGKNISYHFITVPITLSEAQSQSRLNNDCSMNVNSKVMNNITIKHEGLNTTSTITFSDSDTSTRIPNYADPYISSKFKGYTRDEIYRFGIIFYNNKSLPSPVHWIADIKMPHIDQIPAFEYDTDKVLYGRALGIQFTVNNVPAGAVAYEIVRCKREYNDRTVLMQCTASSLYEYRILEQEEHVGRGTELDNSTEMRPTYFPTFMQTNNIKTIIYPYDSDHTTIEADINGALLIRDYVKLIAPEICVSRQDIEKYFKNACYIEPLYTLFSPVNITSTETAKLKEEYPNCSGISRIFANASKVLSPNDGQIHTIKDSYHNAIFLNDSKYIYAMDSDSYDINQNKGSAYYRANISKYYITREFYKQGSSQLFSISDAVYPLDVPDNTFNQGVTPYKVNVGERVYTNYAMSCFDVNRQQTCMGPSGPCVVAYIKDIYNCTALSKTVKYSSGFSYTQENTHDFFSDMPIFNIKVKTSSIYGGNTYVSRQNSIYQSTDSYVRMQGYSTYTTNTYGGDTFLNLLDYPLTTTFRANDNIDPQNGWLSRRRFVGMYIPFESTINMNLFSGDMAHRTYTADNYIDSHLNIDIVQKGTYHIQDKPYYEYNSIYSSQPGSKKFVPKSIYSEDNMHIGNRIMVSQAKTNNEITDSWSMFKVADYLDVDSQYGNISNLYVFKDKLFYFQPTAVGIAAINERSLINDGNVGQLTIGTGGILDRFDYITTMNGSSVVNDRSIVSSSYSLYWYDLDNNEICIYDTQQVQPLSKVKNVQSYLNEMYIDKRDCSLSLYDKKYNEVWFRFYDKSLIYSEYVNSFTSFYTFNPEWSLLFTDLSIGIKNNNFYKLNTVDTDGTNGISKNAKLQIVINKDLQYTKVFDNVMISGDFIDTNNNIVTSTPIYNMQFNTKHQTTGIINKPIVDYREDTYRFYIPRQINKQDNSNDISMSYNARMRGKYLICSYDFIADNEYRFKIPYIITTYRYSMI